MSPQISSLVGTGVCIVLHFISGGHLICCAECRVSNHGLLDTWGSGYPPNALTNNRILNLTWTQSAIEPMRRTAKRALHAQLVCQRCATKSRSFQSDFVFFPQIALAIGVLTSSWGVRVRRVCGFVAGGCHTGSRWRCRLVCVGVRVRRSSVVGGVIFWRVWGQRFADLREGCHGGCLGGVIWCVYGLVSQYYF